MFQKNAVGLARGVNMLKFVYKLCQISFTTSRINHFFLENTTANYLIYYYTIPSPSKFYNFILPESIRKQYGFLTFSGVVRVGTVSRKVTVRKKLFFWWTFRGEKGGGDVIFLTLKNITNRATKTFIPGFPMALNERQNTTFLNKCSATLNHLII